MHFQEDSQLPLWVYPTDDTNWRDKIVDEFHIHPVTAQVLVSRGFASIEDIHQLLYAQLPDLLDPMLMVDMPKAIERICKAIDKKEPVLVYGDNDVDGMTGAALLTEFINRVGGKALSFISGRNILRQTLMIDALEYAISNNCGLMVTVDCGITAATEVEEVVRRGLDVIITDHHEPTDAIPHCVATLNPKLVNSTYPNRELTGVGVAFKLAHGLTNELVSNGRISAKKVDLKRYLDLVALGTISDMGALLGENRIMVRYGLNELRRTKRVGLAKLIEVCELDSSTLNTIDIASKIAPRLNSLGRIADPQKGVQLLLIRNEADAEALALELDLNNIERQKIERTMSVDVEQTLKDQPAILRNKAVVMSSDKWHPGIIPIVATRITKLYNRPTAMIAIEDGIGKGSIRSIPEFPLLPVLKECANILLNFGGHDFAAGLTIRAKDIPAFHEHFLKKAESILDETDILSKLHLDSEVKFSDLTFDFMDSLQLLEPFGNGNPPPILYCEAVQAWPPKIVGKTHLKMFLEQDDRMLEGIAFGMAHERKNLRRKNLPLRIAFTPQINVFQKKASIQLLIRGFQVL